MQVRKSIFKWTKLLSILFFLHIQNLKAAETEFFVDENKASKIRVLGSYYQSEENKSSLIIAAHFQINEGWKIYGPDDSGFGQPPSFDFKNSENIDAKNFKIIWPTPIAQKELIGSESISYTIYKKEVIIPIEIKVLDKKRDVNLDLEINYGLCKEVCIPASQKFNLKIPAGEIDKNSLELIQKYSDKKIISTESSSAKTSDAPTTSKPEINLFRILLAAFIGGFILNIMPCVLPVLSIKVLSIINHKNIKSTKAQLAYGATILGIVFCFVIFALITSILRSAGSSLGWGFQFQNPYFLIFLVLVLAVFIANLLGGFEVRFSYILSSILNKKISESENKNNIFASNFFSGILTVLLATPCSAPFLGTAISFALSQNNAKIFLIFLVMSLGLSFPYFILILFPKMVNLFPKPGAWMMRIKNLMAGFLAATIFWLIYVLSDNIGFLPAIIVLLCGMAILFLFKLDGKVKSWIKLAVLTFLIIISFTAPIGLSKYSSNKEAEFNELWINFDESKINKLVAEGKTVVIDITADWCITCKANKILVLNNKEIMEKLKEPNIIAMRGNLTNHDEKIMNFMRSHNRFAIPFNIIYGPNAPEGILASELLNKEKLLEIINQASQK